MSFLKIFLKTLNNNKFLKKNNPEILEIGCGNGNDVKDFIDNGFSIVGADVEFKKGPHIQSLIEENIIRPITVNASRKDIGTKSTHYAWPVEDESVDFIVSSSVIEHVENLVDFSNESYRTLKDNGYIIHYFPSKYALMEAHVGVPFAGAFKNKNYIKLMHLIGLCKTKFKVRKYTDIIDYLDNFTFYRSDKELIKIFNKAGFSFVKMESKSIVEVKASKFKFFLSLPIVTNLFKLFRSKILIMRKTNI